MSNPVIDPNEVEVKSILQTVTGMAGINNLVNQTIPAIPVISEATFRAGLASNTPKFTYVPGTVGRLGIFSCRKGDSVRAAILLLPASAKPDRVVIGISHGFGQNTKYYSGLGGGDPLSIPFLKDVLLRFVVQRWGAQTLAGRKNMALLLIVRALRQTELGPFARDGQFVADVLASMATLTKDAFKYDHIEAFTYSSGINDLNLFLGAVAPVLGVETVYSLDPAPAMGATGVKSAVRKQFVSGQTGNPPAGFEYMPVNRWVNEDKYPQYKSGKIDLFNYLHNHCMPNYILHLGIQTS